MSTGAISLRLDPFTLSWKRRQLVVTCPFLVHIDTLFQSPFHMFLAAALWWVLKTLGLTEAILWGIQTAMEGPLY